jgi:hypothetical protein
MHYQRQIRYGDALTQPTKRARGEYEDSWVRNCKWCDTIFDCEGDGRKLCCSEECRHIVELLVKTVGKYSLTIARYREMWDAQGGTCEICKRPESSERNELLSVDHDHGTGQVRALLCSHCNRAIGLLGDDPKIIRAAALYVESHRS